MSDRYGSDHIVTLRVAEAAKYSQFVKADLRSWSENVRCDYRSKNLLSTSTGDLTLQVFERIAVIGQHLEGQNTKILSVERAARDNERAHIYQKNTMNEMRQMLLLALSY